MHTLATVQNTRQVNELMAKLRSAGYLIGIDHSTTKAMVDAEGFSALSAISPVKGRWSVQVSSAVAKEFNLPLWKDTPLGGTGLKM